MSTPATISAPSFTTTPAGCTCFAAGWEAHAVGGNAPALSPEPCGWCGTWTPPTVTLPPVVVRLATPYPVSENRIASLVGAVVESGTR